jgi:hypothetical protein
MQTASQLNSVAPEWAELPQSCRKAAARIIRFPTLPLKLPHNLPIFPRAA